MTVQTLIVPFASGRTNGENGGVKIDVPATSVDPGEVVPIYLWGVSADALEGYALAQGADSLGGGTLRQYPGQTEARLFDLDGSGGLKAFTWPVLRLLSVAAVGPCFVVDGKDVSLVALPGEDVTRHFRLSGNALAPAVDSAVGGKLCGSVRATAARSPWCREWSWTVPDEPLAGLPDILCPGTDEARDETSYWFFLLRWGVLAEEFSLALAWTDSYREKKSPYGLVFCVDTTASMIPTIEAVREALGAFLNETGTVSVDIGVVTFGDEVPYRLKLDITHDIAGVSTFIDALSVEGGEDSEENQLDAIRTATTMFDGYKKRIICLITDVDYHVAGDGGNSLTESTPEIVNSELAQSEARLFVCCPEIYLHEQAYLVPHPYDRLDMKWIGDLSDIMIVLTNNLVRELEAL
jgi:hypothetical protein